MIRTGFALSALATAGGMLLVALALPASWHGETVRAGAAFIVEGPDRWLALAGLGAGLGTQTRRNAAAAWAAFAIGTALGLASPHSAVWPWITSQPVFPFRHLLGPAACLLAGLVLLAAGRWRSRLLPAASLAVATALFLAAAINDPTTGGSAFLAGAAFTAVAMALAAAGLRRLLPKRFAGIGERIAGSWLLAIGLLLGALRLAPAPTPTVELAPPVPQPAWTTPDVPGFAPPVRPGDAPFSDQAGRNGFPTGTN